MSVGVVIDRWSTNDLVYSRRMNGQKPKKPWSEEYWDLARVLLLDGALFITILAILLIAFVMLKALGAAGYDPDRIKTIENVHFYTYLSLQIILGFDVVLKFVSILVSRKD